MGYWWSWFADSPLSSKDQEDHGSSVYCSWSWPSYLLVTLVHAWHVCKKEGLANSLGIQWSRLPKALLQPLIGDLRCHKICGTAKRKKRRERERISICVYLCINVDVYGNVGINSFMCVCLHVCVCCGNRTGKGYLFRAHNSKGVNHQHLHLVETQKQAEEWERFLVEKSLQVCPDWRLLFWGGCWGRRLTRRGLLCDWIRVHIWPSLIGPKLEKEDSPICPFSLSQGLNVMMTFFFFFCLILPEI